MYSKTPKMTCVQNWILKNALNVSKFQFIVSNHKITSEYQMYACVVVSVQNQVEKNTPPPKKNNLVWSLCFRNKVSRAINEIFFL